MSRATTNHATVSRSYMDWEVKTQLELHQADQTNFRERMARELLGWGASSSFRFSSRW